MAGSSARCSTCSGARAKRVRQFILAWALVFAAAAPAAAQLSEAPQPIAVPPIPARPKLPPAPKVTLGTLASPGKPDIDIPAAPTVAAVTVPQQAIVTPADPAAPAPPPRPGSETPPPPATSPGADQTKVEETAFIVDPGASQIPSSVQTKLLRIAQDLKDAPLARVEIRAYTPVKGPSESDSRRLSLARWLAVRDYLVAHGVADDRIDGRALASAPSEPNADRVELYLER